MQESPSLSTLEVLLLVCICLQHVGTYHINAVYVQCGSLVEMDISSVYSTVYNQCGNSKVLGLSVATHFLILSILYTLKLKLKSVPMHPNTGTITVKVKCFWRPPKHFNFISMRTYHYMFCLSAHANTLTVIEPITDFYMRL